MIIRVDVLRLNKKLFDNHFCMGLEAFQKGINAGRTGADMNFR